jgi:hypothetical protein
MGAERWSLAKLPEQKRRAFHRNGILLNPNTAPAERRRGIKKQFDKKA